MSSPAFNTLRETGVLISEKQTSALILWLDRTITGCLFVLAACAPHSIAGTQIAWGCALVVWAARLLVRPRPILHRTPVDYALLGFFLLTFFSALFSYDAAESIGKLRSASLFTIVYLVGENVTSRRVVKQLVLVLVASCMVNVIYTLGERIVGRGVKVAGLTTNSPLRAARIQDGDTLLDLDGAPVHDLAEIDRALADGASAATAPAARLRIYRFEWMPTFEVRRGQLLDGDTPQARLGVTSWSPGRDWRASGFYGHYVTYAEVLQLIGALALGLLIAQGRKRTWLAVVLAATLLGISAALLLTVTRAAGLAFLVGAAVIVLAGVASRRAALVVALGALLIVPAGLYVLQQKRNVGFYDRRDGSITWRETVYREGLALLVKRPRHLLVGVGADSIKRYWREWGLFDNGRIPLGHFHSTPLQLAVERGIPTLLCWLALLALYARMLWHLLTRRPGALTWIERGLVLGALGGLVGFFTSGMVHYNLGDSEVAMIFYFVMGLTLVVERETRKIAPPAQAPNAA